MKSLHTNEIIYIYIPFSFILYIHRESFNYIDRKFEHIHKQWTQMGMKSLYANHILYSFCLYFMYLNHLWIMLYIYIYILGKRYIHILMQKITYLKYKYKYRNHKLNNKHPKISSRSNWLYMQINRYIILKRSSHLYTTPPDVRLHLSFPYKAFFSSVYCRGNRC